MTLNKKARHLGKVSLGDGYKLRYRAGKFALYLNGKKTVAGMTALRYAVIINSYNTFTRHYSNHEERYLDYIGYHVVEKTGYPYPDPDGIWSIYGK